MGKKSRKIVGLDPFFQKYFVYDEQKNEIRLFSDIKSTKNDIHTSYLLTKDIITTTIEIGRNIPQEDLVDILTTKAYEELELDPTMEYKISYIELPTELHSKNRKFRLFIAECSLLNERFEKFLKKFGFFDYIFPTPLLLKVLYDKEILVNYETHLFLYFQNSDAFISIYRNGEFIYTKSLQFSFEYIAERLTQMKNSEVTVEELITTLSTYGLRIPDFEDLQYYMKIFSELFMHINDILIYAKKSFEIEKIDKVFISSDIGVIQGLEEYAQTYLGQSAYDFDFDYGIHVADSSITNLHVLAILTTQLCLEEEREECANLTIFERPLPLLKRPSGRILVVMIASIILGFAYPIYYYGMAYKFKLEKLLLQRQFTQIHAKRVALETQINQIKNQIKAIDNQIAAVQKHLTDKKESLKKIYDKKVEYILKAVTIADLAHRIKKHKLHLLDLNNSKKDFNLTLTAADDKYITEFIKDIADNQSNKYDISINDINKTNGLYISIVEVKSK